MHDGFPKYTELMNVKLIYNGHFLHDSKHQSPSAIQCAFYGGLLSVVVKNLCNDWVCFPFFLEMYGHGYCFDAALLRTSA